MDIKINRKKSIIVIVFVTLFLSVFTLLNIDHCKASTLYVGGGGMGNYTSIQQAINAAVSGDIIHIYPGTYSENILINKDIKLVGENRDNTIITGSNNGDVVYVEDCSVDIQNICIEDSGIEEGDAGIELKNVYICKISNVKIQDNYYGIYILFSDIVTIEKSVIFNNYYGNYIYFSSNVSISQNTITKNYRQGDQ